jgi:tetratricopeptide (TPR) repeat protein
MMPPTHLQSADASEAAGQWFAAAWHLEQALRDAPDVDTATADEKRTFSDLYAHCARIIMRQSDVDEWEKVVGLFSKAIEFAPEDWQHYAERASVNDQSNDPKELKSALADYDTAIRLAPSPQRSLYQPCSPA